MQIWSSCGVTCLKSLWQEIKAKLHISNLVLVITVREKAYWDSTLTLEYIETLALSHKWKLTICHFYGVQG